MAAGWSELAMGRIDWQNQGGIERDALVRLMSNTFHSEVTMASVAALFPMNRAFHIRFWLMAE